MDRNLFAEPVYMDSLVKNLDLLIAKSPEANALRKDT